MDRKLNDERYSFRDCPSTLQQRCMDGVGAHKKKIKRVVGRPAGSSMKRRAMLPPNGLKFLNLLCQQLKCVELIHLYAVRLILYTDITVSRTYMAVKCLTVPKLTTLTVYSVIRIWSC